MNMQYLKTQFIPKSKTMKIIYGILWILEPGLMGVIMSYKIIRSRK